MSLCQNVTPVDCLATSYPVPRPPSPALPTCQKIMDCQVEQLIRQLNARILLFLQRCDSALSELRSAQNTEYLDAISSNTSLFGWFVSMQSHTQNHSAASRVDDLRCEALQINQLVHQVMTASARYLPVLNAQALSGYNIRRAENEEHNIFMDWVSNSWYSSMGSMNTAAEIRSTIANVTQVRSEAQSLHYLLNAPTLPAAPPTSSEFCSIPSNPIAILG